MYVYTKKVVDSFEQHIGIKADKLDLEHLFDVIYWEACNTSPIRACSSILSCNGTTDITFSEWDYRHW